ncbi:tyrosyl-DNA phosphodiesterase 1 [Monosporozyma servazzii]
MTPPTARDAVSNRWRQIDYKNDGSAPQQQDVPNLKTNPYYIDLTSDTSGEDTDIEIYEPQLKPQEKRKSVELEEPKQENLNNWCFKLMKSEPYDGSNAMFPQPVNSRHFITLEDILYDSNLEKTMIFSFQYNFDFLFSKIHANVKHITLVAQTGTIQPLSSRKYISILKKCKVIEFEMPPYACHHSKMMINFYRDKTCQIFLPSTNLTYNEANFPQQVCWCSPIFKPAEGTPKHNKFQQSLITYLQSYYQKDLKFHPMISELRNLDFTPLNDDEISFIYSTTNKKVSSGLNLLNNTLHDKGLIGYENKTTTKHFLCQTSSIGNTLLKSRPINIFTHLMIPTWCDMLQVNENDKTIKYIDTDKLLTMYKDEKVKPYIVYPTVKELETVPGGFLAQGWFNFNYEKNMPYYTMLRDKFDVFYKQDPERVSYRRGLLPSHSKFYLHTVTEGGMTDFQELSWCCYTSSNLSLSAWGRITTVPRNYEVGVLLHSKGNDEKLKCYSFTDLVYKGDTLGRGTDLDGSVIVPFTLPVTPYSAEIDECYNRSIHNIQPH